MSNGTEIQVYNVNQHQSFLQKQEAKLEKWIAPSMQLRAEALTRHALHEMSMDQKLLTCTPESIYLALLQCAVTGLVPGKMRGFAYLVPFSNTYGEGKDAVKRTEATFMIGWKGVKYMGYRAGLDIVSAIIHDKDDFDFDKGSEAFVRYKPALKGKGQVIGTAAWCRLPRGGLEIEYLDMERLERIQKQATRFKPSPAWNGDFRDSMQRKSAIRALGRQIEMGEEFHKAEMLQNAEEAGSLASAVDALTDGEATRVLTAASKESIAFGEAPRPAQVQVPADQPAAKLDQAKATVAARAAAKTKPIEAKATENPTTPSSPAQQSSGAGSPTASSASPAAAPQAATLPQATTANPTSAGSASPPASAATPAANSSPSSTTTPTSTASAPASSGENGFDAFDDPEDAPASGPVMSVEAFEKWLATCTKPDQITEGKPMWMQWAREHLTKGSPESIRMQEAHARRWAEVGGK